MGRLHGAVGDRAMAEAIRLDEPDPDGWLRFRLRLPWPDEVPGVLLGVGSSLEVLDPPEVRERLLATAARVLERYRAAEGDAAD